MNDLTDETLMGLPEFLKVMHSSPSTERRMRREEQDWPPHIVLGRKVFYFRDGVRDFLERQRAAQAGAGPESVVAAEALGGEPAQRSPAFTADQQRWLWEVLGRRDWGVVDLDTPKRGRS